MKIWSSRKRRDERGSTVIVYCVVAVSVLVAIAGVANLVARTSTITQRRSNVIAAQQYAQGGVVVACSDLNCALTNGAGTLGTKLTALANPYTRNASLSSAATNVYERTIAAPFTSQSVVAQILIPAVTTPISAKITATATVGPVTQKATANTTMTWGYPGAIISVNAGTAETGISKTPAQDGNVVINGDKSGPIVVDGGSGYAVMANGRINYDTNYANPPASAYSQSNWNTSAQIPDYTSQGSSNALFDMGRFIAVSDLTPESTNLNPNANNHFTNVLTFINAAKKATNSATALEGVITVDVNINDANQKNLTSANLPNGINIKGTWLMNFTGTGWDPTSEKIIVTAAININAADLSHLVVNNPATYPSGYPPVYADNTKNPTNINITSRGYSNFMSGEDLPAEMYTIGVLDMHGAANISGVLYTPSYMEIENKAGLTQYIKGSLIMGNGIYYENAAAGTSIISFDSGTLDGLATMGGVGKRVSLTYWE
jgi:hypothetical protein